MVCGASINYYPYEPPARCDGVTTRSAQLLYDAVTVRDNLGTLVLKTKRSWLIGTNTGTRNYLLLEYIYYVCILYNMRHPSMSVHVHHRTALAPTTRRDVFRSTIRHIAPRVFDDRVSPRRNTHRSATTMFMLNVWDARDVYGQVDGTYSSGSKDNAMGFHSTLHKTLIPLPPNTHTCTRTSNEPGERDYRPFVRRDILARNFGL